MLKVAGVDKPLEVTCHWPGTIEVKVLENSSVPVVVNEAIAPVFSLQVAFVLDHSDVFTIMTEKELRFCS